jgi:hypothetical protein
MVLGLIKPLTEMSTRILCEGKARPDRKADKLTVIFEPILQEMRDPRRVTSVWASVECSMDSLTSLPL